MVLYEDLRVYTIWRAEVAHFKAQHMPYRKTGTEWDILGDLALRLHHREEAKDAYQRALDLKFSAKAWQKLLDFYVEDGDVQRSLNAAIRLLAYEHRWYLETPVGFLVFLLGGGAHTRCSTPPVYLISCSNSSVARAWPSCLTRSSLYVLLTPTGCQSAQLTMTCLQMNVPQDILKKIMQPIFAYAQTFRCVARPRYPERSADSRRLQGGRK